MSTPKTTVATKMGRSAAILACLLAAVPGAEAQARCAPRQHWIELLGHRYAELPAAIVLTRGGQLLEVFTSDNGATWTVLITSAAGINCLVAVGEHWLLRSPPEPAPPDAVS